MNKSDCLRPEKGDTRVIADRVTFENEGVKGYVRAEVFNGRTWQDVPVEEQDSVVDAHINGSGHIVN